MSADWVGVKQHMWRNIGDSFNNLGFKVRASLLIVSIIPLFIYMVLNNVVVGNNLWNLEQESAQERARQAAAVLNKMGRELAETTADYAIWDDAYKNVQERDRTWFQENFTDWLPGNSGIDMILITDINGNVVDSTGITEEAVWEILRDKGITNVLKQYQDSEKYPYGVKVFGNQLYLVSVSPILQNYYKGTPKGIVVIGKLVTPDLLEGIKRDLGIRIILLYGNRVMSASSDLPEVKRFMEIYRTQNGKGAKSKDDIAVMGSAPLVDFSGGEIGRVYTIHPRELFISTLDLNRRNGYVVLTLSLVVIFILSLRLRKVIVDPIKGLEVQISRMTGKHELGLVDVKGSAEIISLADAFNRMATGLQRYKKENESLKTLSVTDHLTQLYNHRYLFEYFAGQVERGIKNMTLLFCDIDHFKVINDIKGHLTGDLVLREIADIIREVVKDDGVAFRYGGEEFIILLADFSPEEAFELAESLRLKVANSTILEKNSGYFPVTVSIGIAAYPANALNVETLVRNADKAMYYAKQNGRNQCRVYSEEIDEQSVIDSMEFTKQEILIESACTLAAVIDAKDRYTEKHSESVVKFALDLAEKLNLSERDRYILRVGGLLHDVGKIGIPDEIIHKFCPLDEHEWRIIKTHPLIGSNIVKHMIKIPEIEACIRYHHERWDGKGYPEGLAGQAIPFYARIISLADAYHSMTSDRPYRKALDQEVAFLQLRKNSGTQFDPSLVEPFIEAVGESCRGTNLEPCFGVN